MSETKIERPYPMCDRCNNVAYATVFEEGRDDTTFPTLCEDHLEEFASEHKTVFYSERYPHADRFKEIEEELDGKEIGGIEILEVGAKWAEHISGPEVAIGFYDDREDPGHRYRHAIAWYRPPFASLQFNGSKWDELDELEEWINEKLRTFETYDEDKNRRRASR